MSKLNLFNLEMCMIVARNINEVRAIFGRPDKSYIYYLSLFQLE